MNQIKAKILLRTLAATLLFLSTQSTASADLKVTVNTNMRGLTLETNSAEILYLTVFSEVSNVLLRVTSNDPTQGQFNASDAATTLLASGASRLKRAVPGGTTFEIQVSADGGETWVSSEEALALAKGFSLHDIISQAGSNISNQEMRAATAILPYLELGTNLEMNAKGLLLMFSLLDKFGVPQAVAVLAKPYGEASYAYSMRDSLDRLNNPPAYLLNSSTNSTSPASGQKVLAETIHSLTTSTIANFLSFKIKFPVLYYENGHCTSAPTGPQAARVVAAPNRQDALANRVVSVAAGNVNVIAAGLTYNSCPVYYAETALLAITPQILAALTANTLYLALQMLTVYEPLHPKQYAALVAVPGASAGNDIYTDNDAVPTLAILLSEIGIPRGSTNIAAKIELSTEPPTLAPNAPTVVNP